MERLSSRERVLTALNHDEPDRVPMDLGGTTASTIVIAAYENLKKYLGLQHQNKLRAARASTVIPDDSVLEHFKIDTRPLLIGDFSNPNAGLTTENRFVDSWGTTWEKAPDGHYINTNGPFQGNDPSIEKLEAYNWPDPDDPNLYKGLRERAEYLRKTTDCAIILNLPLGVVHQCQFVRGFSEWLTDLIAHPEYAQRLMEIVSGIWMRIAQNALEIVGSMIDIIDWGDDVAIQQGPLFSPDMYRNKIKPTHQKMMAALKSNSEAYVVYHSCGSVTKLIEDFIEIGVDALNPVQVSAKDMVPADLKEKYGDRITFWGGIDTHHILPHGTRAEVFEEVGIICRDLGSGGGYVLAAVHNIQHDVPPENIAAMFEAGLKYGQYGSKAA